MKYETTVNVLGVELTIIVEYDYTGNELEFGVVERLDVEDVEIKMSDLEKVILENNLLEQLKEERRDG